MKKVLKVGCLARIQPSAGLPTFEERNKQYYGFTIPGGGIVLCTKCELIDNVRNHYTYNFLWNNKICMIRATSVDPEFVAKFWLKVLT